MKFTLWALLPAVLMTLLTVAADHTRPNDWREGGVVLVMFLSWGFSAFLLFVYWTARIIRYVFRGGR